MSDQELLQRVPQSGLGIGKKTIPLAFFRHGQPGRPFVVCSKEGGRRIYVRASDLQAILNAYRKYLSSRPCRRRRLRETCGTRTPISARQSERFGDQTDAAVSESAVVAFSNKRVSALLDAERRELERANALAVQLIEIKSRLMNTGRLPFADKCLLLLQERHTRHLKRCLRLRTVLAGFCRGRTQDMQPA